MLKPDGMREGETGIIELPNCTESTAKRLLHYLYTNQGGDTKELSLEVIKQNGFDYLNYCLILKILGIT